MNYSAPIPKSLLREALLARANDGSAIGEVRHVGGGDISVAVRVTTQQGVYFAKWQPSGMPPLFEAEARGLALLRGADSGLVVPQVMGLEQNHEGGDCEHPEGMIWVPKAAVSPHRPIAPSPHRPLASQGALLLLEWLEVGGSTSRTAERLGEGLAALHRHIGAQYGLDHDNFIGATPQSNNPCDDWPTFFAKERLGALAKRLQEAGRWSSKRARALEGLQTRLPELLPHHPPPSLLHGDLWGGNWLALADERAALIDPAVYFGDREADLAMTHLFGGFPKRFYEAYQAAWALEAGAAQRLPLYNLYHLMNHLLLFGESYGASVERVLGRYG